MICENCKKEHNGSYGSGRFCSQSCARSFSTLSKRDIINQKVSASLKGRQVSDMTRAKISKNNGSHDHNTREKIQIANKNFWENLSVEERDLLIEKRKHGLRKYFKENKSMPNSILEVSKRTVHKILNRMNLGCLICGWNLAHCDIHHINGRKIKNADSMTNLTYVCPNCHRLIHSGVIDKKELISLQDAIGDSWKDFYFTQEETS